MKPWQVRTNYIDQTTLIQSDTYTGLPLVFSLFKIKPKTSYKLGICLSTEQFLSLSLPTEEDT